MATPSIAERAQDVVEEFALFDDWMGKYEYLIDLGKDVPAIDDSFKTPDYRIHGCQSQVWLRAEEQDGRVYFFADSDALITKGLISLLVRVFTGQPASDIATAQLEFLDKIGLQDHLSATRKNGLAAMVKRMKQYALLFSATVRN